jgi:tetrahydrodipicolinate N-succinyltransferase
MVLAPAARLLALIVNDAVDAARMADPSEVVPSVKATLPVGVVVPDAGFTVTVNCVVADAAMLDGVAVTAVVVAMGEAVTVTLNGDAADAEKPVPPP